MRALLAACVLVGGCALTQPPPKPAAKGPSLEQMRAALAVGSSTKADVRAALGAGTVVDFVSGYEVWVYREQSPTPPAAELVLLFDPSGVLAKTRVR